MTALRAALALVLGVLSGGCNDLHGTIRSSNPYKADIDRNAGVGVVTVVATEIGDGQLDVTFEPADQATFARLSEGLIESNLVDSVPIDCTLHFERTEANFARLRGEQTCELDGKNLVLSGGSLSTVDGVLLVSITGEVDLVAQRNRHYAFNSPGGVGSEHPFVRE